MSSGFPTELLETVRDVDRFHSVFANTLPDMVSKTIGSAARWRARRAWMAFMRENVVEFTQRWPDLTSDLIEMLMEIVGSGRGGDAYQDNARATLWAIHTLLPADDGEVGGS
jgi:hypothetical protein